MTDTAQVHIESREQLLAWLGEAAEIEHNLMCCYLYAMFSLKRSRVENLTEAELTAVTRWRGVLRGIALEEMTHLTLVSNLMSAVGGAPHFIRPNFPVSPGAYPADVVIEQDVEATVKAMEEVGFIHPDHGLDPYIAPLHCFGAVRMNLSTAAISAEVIALAVAAVFFTSVAPRLR